MLTSRSHQVWRADRSSDPVAAKSSEKRA